MSNPGVFELFGFQMPTNSGKRSFRVEDNIGESIHIHFDNLRLDLTVKEFLELADNMLDAINAVVDVKGFDARKQDPLFIFEIAPCLVWLREVRIENIPVKELIVDTPDENGNTVYRYIKHSRVVKALNGDHFEDDRRRQQNLIGQKNRQRLFSMFESVKRNGYPFNEEYITFWNDQNIVRDGQHRAGSIYFLTPDAVIPIQRWIFQDNLFSVPNPVFDLS